MMDDEVREAALEKAAQALWEASRAKMPWRDVGREIREEHRTQTAAAVDAYLAAIRRG